VLRTDIVEDELAPRERLLRLLRKHADEIQIVGEAQSGDTALAVIDSVRPDLVFLDVSLPGLDGFSVLDEIEATVSVVFTTGSTEHAVRAFDAGALHYLLKPVDPARLEEAIERARHPHSRSDLGEATPLGRLLCRDRDTTQVFLPEEVLYLKSDQGYTLVQTTRGEYFTADSLGHLEQKLGPRFVRIHRNCLVNATHVRTLRHPEGELRLVLGDGVELAVSRRYAQGLRARLA
jgi:DNA-binding LytR/AlgR family response regulator